jgi:hypothetical protein
VTIYCKRKTNLKNPITNRGLLKNTKTKKMKRLFLGLLLTISTLAIAQSGKVLDKDGKPQVGCKVTSPELRLTTYTDFDGNYELDIPKGTTLIFDYVSYETEIVVSQDSLIVILKDSQIILEDLIQ